MTSLLLARGTSRRGEENGMIHQRSLHQIILRDSKCDLWYRLVGRKVITSSSSSSSSFLTTCARAWPSSSSSSSSSLNTGSKAHRRLIKRGFQSHLADSPLLQEWVSKDSTGVSLRQALLVLSLTWPIVQSLWSRSLEYFPCAYKITTFVQYVVNV